MELRHLRYFCEVAEHRNFTVAARKLNISQSGVSGQIKDLEREIGVSLFGRNRREVTLTPEGVLLCEEAKAILAKTETAVERVLGLSQGQTGKITIGLCGPVTAPFLPKIIRAFRRQHPRVVVAIRERTPVEQTRALLDGEIDIGFTRSVPVDAKGAVNSEVLMHEPVIVALPKEHLLAKENAVALTALAGEDFVFYCREGAPAVFDSIVAMCRKAKFSPNVVATSRSWQSVLTMVESGEGVSLLPECVQYLRANDIIFRPLQNDRNRLDAYIIWRRNDPNILIEQFLTLLRKRGQPPRSKFASESAGAKRSSRPPSTRARGT